jgi:hypothetical protein
MLVHIWRSSPKESMLGMGTLVLGLLIYFLFPSRPGSGERPSSGQTMQDAARP